MSAVQGRPMTKVKMEQRFAAMGRKVENGSSFLGRSILDICFGYGQSSVTSSGP